MLSFILLGCSVSHYNDTGKEELVGNKLIRTKSDKGEFQYATDSILVKNVVLSTICTYDIGMRRFSSHSIDSMVQQLNRPSKVIFLYSNTPQESTNVGGLYFVEIPKLFGSKSTRKYFKEKGHLPLWWKAHLMFDYWIYHDYYYFDQIPILYVNDSVWMMNSGQVVSDADISLITNQLKAVVDSSYLQEIVTRFKEGPIRRYLYQVRPIVGYWHR